MITAALLKAMVGFGVTVTGMVALVKPAELTTNDDEPTSTPLMLASVAPLEV